MDTNDTRDNRIVEENRKPGTVEWQLQYTSFDNPITLASHPLIRQLRSLAIEGYASKTSVLPVETIDFMVSLDPPGHFTIDLYRMGYYWGYRRATYGPLGALSGRYPAGADDDHRAFT